MLRSIATVEQAMARTKAVRWHALAVFDELKTHLLKSRRVLRSKGNANTKVKHGVRSCNQTNPQLILTHGETLTNRYSLCDRESDCENRSNKSMNTRPDPILFV